jgi:4-alpha-glucanotransferase
MPENGRFHAGRHAGVLVPLFSLPSHRSWGVGEIPDLPRLARWLESAGLDFVQVLPVNEMEEGQNSPYSALSAMAIDPVFIALDDVPEFAKAGGEDQLSAADRRALAAARASRIVDYRTVRGLKAQALRGCFDAFLAQEHGRGTSRDRSLQEFRRRESWWLRDYALFRALHDEHRGRYWREWEPGLRDRHPAALRAARERLAAHLHYYEYLQWVADEQWLRARRDCGAVGIFGDFPFMVSGHSADVWARQHEFRVDASVGVPPDAFSETGQDWGLPVYRWDVIEAGGDEWLRQRARRCTELYDGFRVDHLVGFYRTYVRERDGATAFVPPGEPAQRAQGERVLTRLRDSGARIIAEDLGTVPDFVRESLRDLRVPGLKVLRWERDWHDPGQPFRDPAAYPADSVATSGTHDTETLAEWWDAALPDERLGCAELPAMRESGCDPRAPFSPATRDALLRTLFAAGSDFVLLPIQDVFGWRDRVNTPASISEDNWTWRLPWPVDDLLAVPEAHARARFLRGLSRAHRRSAA